MSSNDENSTLIEIKRLLESTSKAITELANRTKRIETRLAKLMLHEGMTSDGRDALSIWERPAR